MAKQVYKELQEVNENKFDQNPSTVNTGVKGSGFKEAKSNYLKTGANGGIGKSLTDKSPTENAMATEQFELPNYEALRKGLGYMSADGSAVDSGMNLTSSSPYDADIYDTKIMGINIGTPKKTSVVYNPLTGLNDKQEMSRPDKIASTGQSNFSKGINVGTQFIGKSFINAAGGIIGGFYSLGASATQGVKNAFSDEENNPSALALLSDNSVNRFFDKGTEWMEENNTINTHRDGKWASDFFSFNTVKGLGDAASFITGAILSETTLAGLTGGTSLGTVSTRAVNGLSKLGVLGSSTKNANKFYKTLRQIENLVPEANKLASITDKGSDAYRTALAAKKEIEILSKTAGLNPQQLAKALEVTNRAKEATNFMRSTVTGTFWESGLEARQAKDGFISEAMRYKKFELDKDMTLTSDEKEQQLEEYKKEVDKLGDKASSAVFMANMAILKASNMIQFPSIFGNKYSRKLSAISDDVGGTVSMGNVSANGLVRDKATRTLNRQTLRELAEGGTWLDKKHFFSKLEGKVRQIGRAGSNVWTYAKNPLTEAAEEYSQYAISEGFTNYYNSVLDASTSLDPYIASDTVSLLGAFKDALADSTKNNAWDEAIIGGIMGLIGVPNFRKGKNGKVQFELAGGMLGAHKEAQQKQLERQRTVDLYNPENWDKALAESIQRSVTRANTVAQLVDKREEAVDNGDRAGIIESQNDLLINNLVDKLIDGNVEFLQEDLSELANIDLNTEEGLNMFIDTYMNKNELEGKSREEILEYAENSRKDVLDYAKETIDAYNKVASGIQESMRGISVFDESALKFLVHATVKNKMNTERINKLTSEITEELGTIIQRRDLDNIAKLEGEFREAIDATEGLENLMTSIAALNQIIQDNNEALDTDDSTKRARTNIKTAITKLNNLITRLQHNPSQVELLDKIEKAKTSLEKQQGILDTIKEERNKDNIEALTTVEDTYNRVKKESEESLKYIADILNNIRNQRTDTLGAITKRDNVTSSDVADYITSLDKLNAAIAQGAKSKVKNADNFKEYLEENTLKDKLSELYKLENDRLTSQQVAGYFYNNMGSPKTISDALYGSHISSMLSNIAQDIAIADRLSLLSEENDIIANVLANVDISFDKLDSILDKAKDAGLDYRADEGFNSIYEELKDEFTKVSNDLGITIKTEKTVNDNKKTVSEEQERKNLIEEEGTQVSNPEGKPKPKTTVSPKVKNDGFRTRPNRLVWALGLSDLNSETKLKLRELAKAGTIKSESVVRLTSTLTNDKHETDDWFKAVGLDKGKYTRGKSAILNDPSLVDKAFSKDSNPETDGGTGEFTGDVKIKGKVISSDSNEFKKTWTAFSNKKDRTKAEELTVQEVVSTHVERLRSNSQAELTKANAITNASERAARVKEVGLLLDEVSEIDSKLMQLSMIYQGEDLNNELLSEFKELFTDDVLESLGKKTSKSTKKVASQESINIAKVLLDHNPGLSSTGNLDSLASFVENMGITLEGSTNNSDSALEKSNTLFEDVRYYVSNFRVNMAITDGISGKNTDSTSDGNVIFEGFLPATLDIMSQEFLDDIQSKVDARIVELDGLNERLLEAEREGNTLESRDIINAIIDKQAEINTLEEYRNDRTNIEFRKAVLNNSAHNIKLNTVDFGNIPRAELEYNNPDGSLKSVDEITDVKEFTLLSDVEGSSLANSIDDIKSNIVYRTASTAKDSVLYKDMYNNKVDFTRVDGGEGLLELDPDAKTGTYYYIYTDVSGRRIPIKLNKGAVTESIAEVLMVHLNDFFKGNTGVNTFRSKFGTYFSVTQNKKTKSGVLPNTVTITAKEDESGVTSDREIVLTTRKGNTITINDSNFGNKDMIDTFKDGLLESRSNVKLGNLLDEDGTIDDNVLKLIIENNLLNTSLDVKANFDKIYPMDENGEPDVNLSFTPTSFNSSEDKLPSRSKTQFLNTIKTMLNIDSVEALDGKTISSKLKERLMYNIANQYNKLLAERKATETAENNALLDKYEKYVTVAGEKPTESELKTVKNILNTTLADTIVRMTDPNNANYINNGFTNIVANISNLKNVYPMYFTRGKKVNSIHLINTMLDDVLGVTTNILKQGAEGNKTREAITRYAYFEKSRDKIADKLEEKNAHNKNRKTLNVNSYNKEGVPVLNNKALEEFTQYLDLLKEVYRYKSVYSKDLIPLSFRLTQQGKGTSYAESNSGGITAILTTTMDEGRLSIRAKGVNDNEYQVKLNEQNNTKYNTKSYFFNMGELPANTAVLNNPVIPNFTAEELADFKAYIEQGPEERNNMLRATKVISDKQYEEALEFLNKKKEEATLPTKPKYDIAFEHIEGDPLDVRAVLEKKINGILSKNENEPDKLATYSEATKAKYKGRLRPGNVIGMGTPLNTGIAYNVFNDIVKNQGIGVFIEGPITIPIYNEGVEKFTIESDHPFMEDEVVDRKYAIIDNNKKGKTIEIEEFFKSEDDLIVALRYIYTTFALNDPSLRPEQQEEEKPPVKKASPKANKPSKPSTATIEMNNEFEGLSTKEMLMKKYNISSEPSLTVSDFTAFKQFVTDMNASGKTVNSEVSDIKKFKEFKEMFNSSKDMLLKLMSNNYEC